MMMKTQRHRQILIWLLTSFFILSGCSSSEELSFQKATEKQANKEYTEALVIYEQLIARDPKNKIGLQSTREAAKLSYFETKNYQQAAKFYKSLILFSEDQKERLESQEKIASIYFDHLTDYNLSILEINRLLGMQLDPSKKIEYRIKLARAYFYLNNFFQSESEVRELLKSNISSEQKLDLLILLGNIFLARKDLNSAAVQFREIVSLYPEKAHQDNIGLSLAVCYEELKDYGNAIKILESIKSKHAFPEYIQLRIKRLQERQKNQPGARGLRK